MEVVRGIAELARPLDHPVLTIGNFDGLHLGHRSIVNTVVEQAEALGGEPVAYTFDPHPRSVLFPERAPKLLVTLEQKLDLFEEAGIRMVIVEPFTIEFSRTPPEVFVREVIHKRIQPRKVYVGYDFHFGKDREGSMRLLTDLGPRLGFEVTIIPEVLIDDRDVNSTRIRALLADGEVDEAGELLGRLYTIRGQVVQGDQRGRELGFPTLNLAPENEILPQLGVYAAWVRILDEERAGGEPGSPHRAVANIGLRPTFKKGETPLAEAHLIDFEGDLYGARVEIAFVRRLRQELRFPDARALEKAIRADVDQARGILVPESQKPVVYDPFGENS